MSAELHQPPPVATLFRLLHTSGEPIAVHSISWPADRPGFPRNFEVETGPLPAPFAGAYVLVALHSHVMEFLAEATGFWFVNRGHVDGCTVHIGRADMAYHLDVEVARTECW